MVRTRAMRAQNPSPVPNPPRPAGNGNVARANATSNSTVVLTRLRASTVRDTERSVAEEQRRLMADTVRRRRRRLRPSTRGVAEISEARKRTRSLTIQKHPKVPKGQARTPNPPPRRRTVRRPAAPEANQIHDTIMVEAAPQPPNEDPEPQPDEEDPSPVNDDFAIHEDEEHNNTGADGSSSNAEEHDSDKENRDPLGDLDLPDVDFEDNEEDQGDEGQQEAIDADRGDGQVEEGDERPQEDSNEDPSAAAAAAAAPRTVPSEPAGSSDNPNPNPEAAEDANAPANAPEQNTMFICCQCAAHWHLFGFNFQCDCGHHMMSCHSCSVRRIG